MASVFVVKNQSGLFLNKQQEWVEGNDNHTLYRTAHKDEAFNTVFEVSSRDIYLRAETLTCECDEKGNPLVTVAAALTPTTEEPSSIPEEIETDDINTA